MHAAFVYKKARMHEGRRPSGHSDMPVTGVPTEHRDAKRRRPFRDTPPFCPWPDPFRDPVREGASALGASDRPVAADRHDTEVIATVLLPAGFVVLGANRALLAIAHEGEAICRNAVVNEVPLGGSRTALA